MAFFGAAERLALDSRQSNNRRNAGRLAVGGVRSNLGAVLDLSGKGVRLRQRRWQAKLPKNTPVRIDLTYGDARVVVIAEVRWTKLGGRLSREIGLEFTVVDDDSRQDLNRMAAACSGEAMSYYYTTGVHPSLKKR